MVKEELIQRSPVRVLMNSIQGGLKGGELGIIASPSGIGKTSMLVQIALDKLLQGKKVIHVSFTQHTDYILAWYEDIFNEFIRKKNLENEEEAKNDIVKNRVIMRFTQEGHPVEAIIKSLSALISEGGFNADCIIVDGLNFAATNQERVSKVKAFAAKTGVSIWYSCNVQGEKPLFDKRNIPLVIKDYENCFEVIILMEPKQTHIALTVSKDRDSYNPEHMALKLDPRTLLIMES